jgi:trans-aconitate methyltransferase
MAQTHWDAQRYQKRHSYVFEYGKAVLDLLNPQAGERILDLGCGSGQLTNEIARSGASVVGLDSSPEMLDQARKNFPHIEFVLADAAKFEVDRPADAVFSNAVLHWVKDAAGAARSIARALKPGGRFVAEFGGSGNIASILRALRQVLGPFETPWFYPSIGEYATLLERHGFETRQAWLIDRPTPLAGEDGMEDWLAMFCSGLAAHLSPEQQRDTWRAVADRLRPTHFRGGVWTLDYRRLRIVAEQVG